MVRKITDYPLVIRHSPLQEAWRLGGAVLIFPSESAQKAPDGRASLRSDEKIKNHMRSLHTRTLTTE